jgi:hypothetical protein
MYTTKSAKIVVVVVLVEEIVDVEDVVEVDELVEDVDDAVDVDELVAIVVDEDYVVELLLGPVGMSFLQKVKAKIIIRTVQKKNIEICNFRDLIARIISNKGRIS